MSETNAKRDGGAGRQKLLVVDDDKYVREMLENALAGEGFGVVTAENGLEGVRKAREEAPDLILLNLLMPVMDGFAACRELKSSPETRDIPVIIFSACLDVDEWATRALWLGAEDFIQSPFSSREVVELVRTVFESERRH